MKPSSAFFFAFLWLLVSSAKAQSLFNGKYNIMSYTHTENGVGYKYILYDFSRDGNVIKAKYFAKEPYKKYLQWKGDKKILLIAPGAFSDSFDPATALPVGICVDGGQKINSNLNTDWDGMVIVYNGAAQQGGVAVVDLKVNKVNVRESYPNGAMIAYDVRNNSVDRVNFLSWGEREGVTLFQTMLPYSSDKTVNTNLNNPHFGKFQERRFWAICRKGGVVHHVIVDAPDNLEMNVSAIYAKSVLEYAGFSVLYIMTLDVGDKNFLYTYDGTQLVDHKILTLATAKIENATNMIIYYMDN